MPDIMVKKQENPDLSNYASWSRKKKFWYPIGHTVYFATGAIVGGGFGIGVGAAIGGGAMVLTGLFESVAAQSLTTGFTETATGALPLEIGILALAGLIGAATGINRALAEYYRDFGRKRIRR